MTWHESDSTETSREPEAWEAAAELALMRDRIEALELEAQERERALERAEDRAAGLERRIATIEVELEDARARRDQLVGTVAALRERVAAAEGAAVRSVARRVPVAEPEPPDSADPVDPTDPPPLEDAEGRQDARAHSRAAARLYDAGDYEGAARAYRAAAHLSPRDPGPSLGLARSLRNLRRFDESLAAAEEALAIKPGWRDATWVALLALSRLERAQDFALLAASLGPTAKTGRRDLERMAPLALRAGAHGLAREIGERLVELEPQGRSARYTLAAARWELGDDGAPRELIDEALRTRDPAITGAALDISRHVDDFADVLRLLGHFEPVERDLQLAFADAFLKRGEPKPALELLSRLEQDDPQVEEARVRAVRLERLHDGSWVPRLRTPTPERVPGRPLHLVSHSLPHHTSGGTYRTHYIAKVQRQAGLDPQMVTPLGFPESWDPELGDSDVVDGIAYHRLPDPAPSTGGVDAKQARNLEALVPLVERLGPSVLHPASDFMNALLALQLRELFGIPVVYEVRGFPEERLVRRPASRALNDQSVGRRAMELECMLAADRIVTLGETMKRHMIERGVPGEKIRIVPNGVDPEVLKPAPRDEALAARLGIRDGETVLGYVSTFHGYEGIQYIVRATAELIKRGKRARALLVGDGRERPYLESLARELGVADRVVFTGRVPHDHVLSYYALIDLFIVPRRAEATSELVTPLKPFEALGVERTVIASDVGALREIITDGETGRMFPAEDAGALADVCEQLIDDPDQARRLAAAGRDWVMRERTWDRNGARYRELYEELGAASPVNET